MCDEGLSISVSELDHRPSWSEESGGLEHGWVRITHNFDGVDNVAAAGVTGFETTITWDDSFEFDSEKYYRFSYSNCLTTGGIPDHETGFSNSATFNGAQISGTAYSPGFWENKWGRLVTQPQDVAGETHPAGTTIDWNIEIDGQKFEDQQTLEVTDEFSDTLTVCEADGKSLNDRLNFYVEARDFVYSGGLASVNMTDATDVELDGNTLTFTLDKDKFGEGHFSRDYYYVISYTLCTSSGGLDGVGTEYSNSAQATGNTMYRSVNQNWNGGADGNGVSRGSFSLLKSAAADSQPFGEDLEFTVKVEEFAPVRDENGNLAPADLSLPTTVPAQQYEVRVKADGTPVSGHFMRGTNWQIRLTEVGFPQDSGFIFEPGRFVDAKTPGVTISEDGSQAVIAIAPRENIQVELRNKATTGSATIAKRVEGDAAGASQIANQSDSVTAFITSPEGATSQQTLALTDGMNSTISDLRIGSKVRFSEAQPADNDQVTWGEPVFDPGNEITITADNPRVNVLLKTRPMTPSVPLKFPRRSLVPRLSTAMSRITSRCLRSGMMPTDKPKKKRLSFRKTAQPNSANR